MLCRKALGRSGASIYSLNIVFAKIASVNLIYPSLLGVRFKL